MKRVHAHLWSQVGWVEVRDPRKSRRLAELAAGVGLVPRPTLLDLTAIGVLKMVTKGEIPDMAICHKCGNPMRVVDLNAKARRLAVQVPDESFLIKCCESELTIEDEEAARQVRDLLAEYHAAESGADERIDDGR